MPALSKPRAHGYTEPMKIHHALLSLALFGICSTAFAQWQWLDASGRKVFSDRAPPPEVSEANILKRPNAKAPAAAEPIAKEKIPATPASAPMGALEKELLAKKKQSADEEAAKRRADEERNAKAKIENCARAKQAKATVDSGMRISRANAAGQIEVLDEAALAKERAHIQSIIDSECR